MDGMDQTTRWKEMSLEYGPSRFSISMAILQFNIIQRLNSNLNTTMEFELIESQLGYNSLLLIQLKLQPFTMVFTVIYQLQKGMNLSTQVHQNRKRHEYMRLMSE